MATETGLERARDLDVDPDEREHLKRLVQWARKQTFAQLVSAVYEKHPEMKQNSIFRNPLH